AGINIGAETPQEIAISIIAEMLSVFRHQQIIPLKHKQGRIHSSMNMTIKPSPMTTNVAIVILTAGASRRMRVPKQLIPWGNMSLLNHVIHTASALDVEVHVILGARNKMIKPELPKVKNVHSHINQYGEKGIGNSIAFAVSTLADLKLDGIL